MQLSFGTTSGQCGYFRSGDKRMLKARRIVLSLALLIATFAISWAQSQPTPQPNKEPQAAQQPTRADQRGTQQSPAFIKIIPTPKTEAETAQEAADREEKTSTDLWIIRWTGAVALFTLVLAGVGIWQGIQLKRTVDLAQKELIASHRPKIRIRRITAIRPVGIPVVDTGRPNSALLPGNRVSVVIEAANVGDTDATVFEMGIDIYVPGPFNAAPQPYPGIPPVAPGQDVRMTASGGRLISEAEIDAIEVGTLELRLLGIINYRDDNGVVRSTSFARKYDRALGRFANVPDDDAEADREFEN
jgi:hypothetical protein